ncbi:MAG: bifunctional adenosylcobinamide kinase/adenosylcobinamide-phosphate guanylyltransferase [Lachnospiraceae bacterium]
MILVTGGCFQGKKEYVKKRFGVSSEEIADGAVCSMEELYEAKVLDHFHEYLKRILQGNTAVSAEELAELIAAKNPELILITNELGYGVVPLEKFDRVYREYTGRVCCEVAKNAKEVHRVICGIGTVIKC